MGVLTSLSLVLLISSCVTYTAQCQRLDELTSQEASRCDKKPGSSAKYKLVSEQYWQLAQQTGDVNFPHYTLANDSRKPVPVENGCPVHYGMRHDEHIHFQVVREFNDSVLLAQWDQVDWFAVAKMSWSKELIPFSTNNVYYLWQSRLRGQAVWTPAQNHDFFTHEEENGVHLGEADPLIVDVGSGLEGSDPSKYEGMWKMTFHQVGSHMQESDYNVLLDLYLNACAPYRGDQTDPYAAWNTSYDVQAHINTVNNDIDTVPYCGWMIRGWDTTALQADNYAEACERIDFVRCDADGYVTHTFLDMVGLRGTVPAKLGEMTKLQSLSMKWNRFTGILPDVWSNHPELKNLNFRHNQLSGPVPCFSGDVHLEVIDLGINKFNGTLPQGACINEASELTYLHFDSNFLRGTIPDWIGLGHLSYVAIERNLLEGTVPHSICQLLSMDTIFMSENQIVGTIPHDCINPQSGVIGWERLNFLDIRDNRFTGSVPKLGANMLNFKRFWASYNYFEGALSDQLEVMVLHAERDAQTEVFLDGNLLNGPYPTLAYDMTTQKEQLTSLRLYDNKFRCENNGRWPDWAKRMFAQQWWFGYYGPSEDTDGSCIPVPNPSAVSPEQGRVAQVISVMGTNIGRSAHPRCKFYSTSTSITAFSDGQVVTGSSPQDKPRVQCYVPTTLGSDQERYLKVTISNYGDDFASLEYWQGSTTVYDPPTFLLLPLEAMEIGVVVKTSMVLEGVTEATFNEADFRQMIAEISQVPAVDITIQLTSPDERRLRNVQSRSLTSGLTVYVSINIPAANPSDQATIDLVDEIKVRLEDPEIVQQALSRFGIEAASTQLQTASEAVEPPVETLTVTNTEKEEQTVLGVALAAACTVVAICLLGCVCFIRRREKQGTPYFQEALGDGGRGQTYA